jgi:hypothetical protein
MSRAGNQTTTAPWPAAQVAWLRDPVARNYLFVGLASLLITSAVLVFRHGHLAAALPVILGGLGLILRSPVLPGLYLLVLNLSVVPLIVWQNRIVYSDVPISHFRIMDLVLVGATLSYFACQFRLLSLSLLAMPSDAPVGHRMKDDRTPKRPGTTAPPEELGRMFAVIALCVVLGQLVWLVISEFRFDMRYSLPIRFARPAVSVVRGYSTSEPLYRFLMLAGLVAVVALPTALVFWYWRLTRLSPGEARMVLLDCGWRESRRELNRQEKWRAWGATRRKPRPDLRPRLQLNEKPQPTGPRRSFFEALALTCGMVFFGGIAAFVVVIVLIRYLGQI